MKLRKLFAAVLAGVTVLSSMSFAAFAGEVPAPGEFDANGEYVAQMYIQMDGSWVFRNKWDDPAYGTAMGYEFGDRLSQVEGDPVEQAGEFTDVVLKGNGTYTIKLENPDLVKKVDGNEVLPTKFNMIGISTNIPASAQDTVKFTDATIKINNSAVYTHTYDECLVDEEDEDYMLLPFVNAYNKDYADVNEKLGGTPDTFMGDVTSVEITFTVSGFAYDNPDAVVETEATTEAPKTETNNADKATTASASTDADSSNTGLIIGIVAAVVVVVIIVVAVVVSKKKKNK